MFPIVVGAWLPVLTFLTYAAHRLRLPILAIAVLLFTVVANYMPRLHVMRILEQDAQSGPLQSRQPSLEESLQWWRKANGCPEALRSECNVRPIIVAAEGGASRAVDEVRLGCGDARDYHLTLGQPDLLEQLPFVCVARVSGFERDGMRIGEETGRPLATAFPGLALDGYTDRRGGGGGAAAGRRPRRSALRKAAGIAARHPSRRARNPIRRPQRNFTVPEKPCAADQRRLHPGSERTGRYRSGQGWQRCMRVSWTRMDGSARARSLLHTGADDTSSSFACLRTLPTPDWRLAP